ncbi:MAG: hypothetical protein ACM339_07480 [Ignavibacteria bacterium]
MKLLEWLLVVNFFLSYTIQAQDVVLNISLDKYEYLKGGPIPNKQPTTNNTYPLWALVDSNH